MIEKLKKSDELKKNWFLANSTHVIDLAFSLLVNQERNLFLYLGESLNGISQVYFVDRVYQKIIVYLAIMPIGNHLVDEELKSIPQKEKLILSPLEILQEQQIGSLLK